jgi:hypothetical protein
MEPPEFQQFNELCERLEQTGVLNKFYHALHEIMFPGKTHLGEYNMIHAINSSHAEDWRKALEVIMSWSVSQEVTKENAVDQIMSMEPTYEIGEGAKFQLVKAKESAIEQIASGAVKGEKFGVSLSGHSQSDSPDSSPDSISISIYART